MPPPPAKFLVCGTRTYLLLKDFSCHLGFRMVIEVLTFLSVFDKWQFGYYSDWPVEVIDYFFTEMRNTNYVWVLNVISILIHEIWRRSFWYTSIIILNQIHTS